MMALRTGTVKILERLRAKWLAYRVRSINTDLEFRSASTGRERVLVVAKGFPPEVGGIETYSERMALAYAGRGISVTVLTRCGPKAASRASQNNLSIIDVGASSTQLIVLVRFYLALKRLARSGPFDFVHATSWRVFVPVMLASFTGSKVARTSIVTVHGREIFVVPKLLRPIMEYILSKCSVVTFVSNAVRSAYAAATNSSASHWITVWNGISFRQEAEEAPLFRPNAPVRLYTFCRLVERKNVRAAIEAVAILKSRKVDGFTFDIAGDGPERPGLVELVERLCLSNTVQFLGYISDEQVVQNYRTAHIFIHPQIASRGGHDVEGFGIAIADAMSFGVATVVGRDGGPSDFVKHKETGLVVDGSDVEAIADAMQFLIEETEARKRISRLGREFALSELDWSKSAQRICSEVRVNRELSGLPR